MARQSVIVIGAGAAGLMAALELAKANYRVTILEARRRPGGRIYSKRFRSAEAPVELGAEFIHGADNETWPLIREAGLATVEVPDRHWRIVHSAWRPMHSLWEEMGRLFQRIDTSHPDQSFAEFLAGVPGVDEATRRLAINFVEGFNAADARRISSHALAKVNAESSPDDNRAFRLGPGYSALIDWLQGQCVRRQVALHFNTIVRQVRWKPGQVEAIAQHRAHRRTFEAARALITLPLGVLQHRGRGSLEFLPGLPEKREAITALEIGTVVRITLRFRERFWPVPDFGFLHAQDELLPTWWADERGPWLTGWVGGPRAAQLRPKGESFIRAQALTTLARISGVARRKIENLLEGVSSHDWSRDPFSRGAYSYIPAGQLEAPRQLSQPVADTLFFAGEATVHNLQLGTVSGALSTGRRAARQILECGARLP